MSVRSKGFFSGMNRNRTENSRITGFLIGKPIKLAGFCLSEVMYLQLSGL